MKTGDNSVAWYNRYLLAEISTLNYPWRKGPFKKKTSIRKMYGGNTVAWTELIVIAFYSVDSPSVSAQSGILTIRLRLIHIIHYCWEYIPGTIVYCNHENLRGLFWNKLVTGILKNLSNNKGDNFLLIIIVTNRVELRVLHYRQQ